MAVPGAVAEHPFWASPLKQAAGWARGDVLCLEHLPHQTFYSLPNWAEWLLLIFLCTTYQSLPKSLCLSSLAFYPEVSQAALLGVRGSASYTALVVTSLHVLCRLGFNMIPDSMTAQTLQRNCTAAPWKRSLPMQRHQLKGPQGLSMAKMAFTFAKQPKVALRRAAVSFLALVPEMVQDVIRVTSKVHRLKFNQLCMSFDWFDGQGNQRVATHIFLFVFNLALLIVGTFCLPVRLLDLVNVTVIDVKSAFIAFITLLLPLVIFSSVNMLPRGWSLLDLARLPFKGLAADTQPRVQFLSMHVQPFVILSYQRSGSNLLCGLLNSHPEVAMHNELFHDQTICILSGMFQQSGRPQSVIRGPVSFSLRRSPDRGL